MGYHFLRKSWGPRYTGGHNILERKIGGHKIFDDQNVGSHKMTTDSVFILFKNNFSLFRGKVYRWWGVINVLLPK